VRTDHHVARTSFRFSDAWKRDATTGRLSPSIDQRLAGTETTEDGRTVVHSLSGNERNRFFLNLGGQQFANLSAVSGLDNPADGRGWALLDYDRDGWQDVALVNANEPLFNLYHNDIAQVLDRRDDGMARGFIAVRFEGGNRRPEPSPDGHANRDGYGALAEVRLGANTLVREHRCGEGYASQHSNTLVIGIGETQEADSLTVTWPSGRTSTAGPVPAGSLVTAYENPADNPGGTPFATGPYLRPATGGRPPESRAQPETNGSRFPLASTSAPDSGTGPAPRLRLFTTTATWCPSCLAHLPDLTLLRSAFSPEELDLVGVPIDPSDPAEALREYAESHQPPYRLLADLPPDQRRATADLLKSLTGSPDLLLPTSVLTGSSGQILTVTPGIPTLSAIRRHLAQAP
jgi:hypothetical protein